MAFPTLPLLGAAIFLVGVVSAQRGMIMRPMGAPAIQEITIKPASSPVPAYSQATNTSTSAPAVVPMAPTNVSSDQPPVIDLTGNGDTITGEPSLGVTAPKGYTFYGIKFGKAERFQDSVINKDHSYLKDYATKKGPKGAMCMQTPNSSPWTSTGVSEFSEDCLFLDIFVPPKWNEQPTPLPVFFWSWGGLMINSGRGIPGAGADLAKSLKAIVVIPQFRVGAFGFLSTGDTEAAGNYALSDHKTAFNFIHDNIQKFNGDPNRITVSGQSDGAALVSAMLLDQDVAHKVFGAVTMSGSVLSPWAIDEQPLNKTVALATTAACPTTPTSAMVECLKKIPAKELQTIAEKMYAASEHAPGVPIWTMVVDSNHILYDPEWILKDSNRKGLIGGFVHQYNKQDASIVALRAFGAYITGPGKPSLGFLKTVGIPMVIRQATLCRNLSSATIDLVAKTYGMVEGADELTLRNAFYQLTTDVNHGLSSVKEAILYSQTDATRYGNSISVLAYDADISKFSPLANFTSGGGVYHTCDVGYLFSGSMSPLLAGQTDLEVTKVFRQQFNSLITRGYGLGETFDPTTQNYIELGQDKKWHKQNFGRTVELVKFWDKLKELRCTPPPPNACGPEMPAPMPVPVPVRSA